MSSGILPGKSDNFHINIQYNYHLFDKKSIFDRTSLSTLIDADDIGFSMASSLLQSPLEEPDHFHCNNSVTFNPDETDLTSYLRSLTPASYLDCL